MKLEHTLNNKEGIVTVKGTLKPRAGHKVVIREKNVREYLKNNKINIEKCIINNCVIDSLETQVGEWVFKLDTPTRNVVKSKSDKAEHKTETQEPKERSTKQRKRKLSVIQSDENT
jgi:hypothetical protein|tara:strand:+ start:8354 stop:8701 length:348 start_codon:yes stop_codon:yes gene_type:complete